MSFAVFKQAQAPTAVDVAVRADFTIASGRDGAGASSNLVLAKANVLEVYDVLEDPATSESARATSSRMELVGSWTLHGRIEGLVALPRQQAFAQQRDALLLAFAPAKLCVVEFDAAMRSLRTTSMHGFDDVEALKRGKSSFPTPPRVAADPQGRCAAAVVYADALVVLVAVEGSAFGEEHEEAAGGKQGAAGVAGSYTVDLHELGIGRVKSIAFLNGYSEPVLLVLHEGEPTWAGRLRERKNTGRAVALSLNLSLRSAARIWDVNRLPHDAKQVVAVPPPANGALVVCPNLLIYQTEVENKVLLLNQLAATQPFPKRAEGEPEPDMPQLGPLEMPPNCVESMAVGAPKSDVELCTDIAHFTWLSPLSCLVAVGDGTLYLLKLGFNGIRVEGLTIARAGLAVIPSCVCTVSSSLLFIGSRAGDSLLIKYTGKSDETGEERPSKRPRLGENGTADGVGEESDVSDPELEEIYQMEESKERNEEEEPDEPDKYTFQVQDSLLGLGTLRDVTTREGSGPDGRAELIACVGQGKGGAMALFHRHVYPDVVTEVALPAIRALWTVYSSEQEESTRGRAAHYHAYMILSLEKSTMVLETGTELNEVTEKVDFATNSPTVTVGNVGSLTKIVQVCPGTVFLLRHGKCLQKETVDGELMKAPSGASVKFAAVKDPFVLILLSTGQVKVLRYLTPSGCLQAVDTSLMNLDGDPVVTCALYEDRNKWLGNVHSGATCFAALGRQSSRMEIWSLLLGADDTTTPKQIFDCKTFPEGSSVLEETTAEMETAMSSSRATWPAIVEIRMEIFGETVAERPLLLALLSDGSILAYEAFDVSAEGSGIYEGNPLRFTRMSIEWLTTEQVYTGPANVEVQKDVLALPAPALSKLPSPQMLRFDNIGDMHSGTSSGIFVCGANPAWLMMSRRKLRLHPMKPEKDPIIGFAPFHNVNCENGFITCNRTGVLRICQLPSRVRFDNDWPVQKVPLRCTPHKIVYHNTSECFALITSQKVPTRPRPPLESGGDAHAHASEVTAEEAAKVRGEEEGYEVKVISATNMQLSWNQILDPGECAVCLEVVSLLNTGINEVEEYLAVGTSTSNGEDCPCRGRVLLFHISRSEDKEVQVGFRFASQFRGPVSVIKSLAGHLLLAIGTRIVMHVWTGRTLFGAAFHEFPIFVTSISVVKNFIVVGDLHRGIFFIRWKDEGKQLTLLGKDFDVLDVLKTECLIDGNSLSLFAADSLRNIHVFGYAPQSVESYKGQKLLNRSAFHLDAEISTVIRSKLRSTTPKVKSNRFACLVFTTDGSIGFVPPINESTCRRLQALQKQLTLMVPQVAGLNPRAFRRMKLRVRRKIPPDNLLDGDLLWSFDQLSRTFQNMVARKIGSTRQQILANLWELNLAINAL